MEAAKTVITQKPLESQIYHFTTLPDTPPPSASPLLESFPSHSILLRRRSSIQPPPPLSVHLQILEETDEVATTSTPSLPIARSKLFILARKYGMSPRSLSRPLKVLSVVMFLLILVNFVLGHLVGWYLPEFDEGVVGSYSARIPYFSDLKHVELEAILPVFVK